MADENRSTDISTVASDVHLAELCGLLEKISKTQGNDKKKKILKKIVQQWRESHDKLHGKTSKTLAFKIWSFKETVYI